MDERYIRSTMYQCASECGNGCQFYTLAPALEKTQDLLYRVTKGETSEMSRVLWCDRHDGPFSAKDPAKQRFGKEYTGEDGKPVSESMDICGPCAQEFTVKKSSVAAIAGGVDFQAEREV